MAEPTRSTNGQKYDFIKAGNADLDSLTANSSETKNVLNASVGGVTESLNRSINLPSTILTPSFGLFKLSQEVAVFRTAMSLVSSLNRKYSKIKNIFDSFENDLSSKQDAINSVHQIIAKRIKEGS